MRHTKQQELISLYIDHALNDKESSELFAHLARCGECRTYLKISMRVRAQIVNQELARVPESLDRRILASVVRENADVRKLAWYSPVWFTRISIPLPAAASIVFLIIVGSLLFYPLLSAEPQRRVEVPSELMSRVPAGLQRTF